MEERKSHLRARDNARPSRRDRFWTVATTAVLVAASLGMWHSLRLLHQEYVQRVTTEFADSIAIEISWHFDDQRRAARRLAQYWVRFGRQEYPEWHYDTRIYLEDNDLDSVVWNDPEFGDEIWEARIGDPVRPVREQDAAALAHAHQLVAENRSELTAGPFALQDGNHGYWIIVPVGKGRMDTLVAGRRLQSIFDTVARDRTEQCALSIHFGQLPIYEREAPSCTAEVEASVPIPVFDGGAWVLTTRPRADILGFGRALPPVVLVGGLLTAALLGTVMWTRGITRSKEEQLRMLNMELESRIRARTAALDEAVRESRAFNYSVSHDLRSPLGAVVNFAGILAEDKGDLLDDEGREHVERIQGSAKRALSMLDSLLEFSRVGRSDVKKQDLDLRAMVEDAWNEITVSQAEPGARLEYRDLPRVFADPALLRQALSNLLSNALKFSAGRAHPEIEVGGRVVDGRTEIWVGDNGVGFSMEDADKLFKVFSRLHSPSRFSGHGVGLAIVESIARRHGGTVRAEGEPDAGATFYISLPNGAS